MSSKKKHANANIALCYVRQSRTKDEKDTDSPERQESNIKIVLAQYGWEGEWYSDTEGHKSGTSVANRPGWLSLEKRLSDPDVVGLVANDLSRLHRKNWRIGQLIDFANECGVKLVIAAPGKQMDFSTPQGIALVQMSSIFDEWYAKDISIRSKDSIAFRKRSGITVGLPPFGTKRGEDGFLIPSQEGAWLLPDGSFALESNNQTLIQGAIWRGYYDAARTVLEKYAEGKFGWDTVAYQMNIERWAFRNRQGKPVEFEGDDIRRIVTNWPEYGGYVHLAHKRAKERHPFDYLYDQIPLNPDLSVFPIELLYKVAKVHSTRSIKRKKSFGVNPSSYPYPLSEITYCYHCDQQAKQFLDSDYSSRLGGHTSNSAGKIRRYRHKSGVKCGCTNRSVKADIYEADFLRLLKLLTVDTQEIDLMREMSIQFAEQKDDEPANFEAEKQAAIAKLKFKRERVIETYHDGLTSHEKMLSIVAACDEEITHWESRTTETAQVTLELIHCIDAVQKMASLWEHSNDEDKRGMARNLFKYIIYDLDTQRIVDFRLKSWAERFVRVRGSLYEDGSGVEGEDFKVCKPVAPTRFELVSSP